MQSTPAHSVHSQFYPNQSEKRRLFSLAYFATLLSIAAVVGKLILGFELSWAQLTISLLGALATQLLMETIEARSERRPARFAGGIQNIAKMMLPAWITGLSVSILIYPGDRLTPILFCSIASIASKFIFRVPTEKGRVHFYNPSNFGISLTLVLFADIGIAPPYQFTENVTGLWNWVIPGIIILTGVLMHGVATRRLPLCLAWIAGFVAQALFRSLLWHIPLLPLAIPMTGAAFVLFTLYMIPDPATSPLNPASQCAFGASVAAVYGLLQVTHVVYGLFLSLFIVCSFRGARLWLSAFAASSLMRAQSSLKETTTQALPSFAKE